MRGALADAAEASGPVEDVRAAAEAGTATAWVYRKSTVWSLALAPTVTVTGLHELIPLSPRPPQDAPQTGEQRPAPEAGHPGGPVRRRPAGAVRGTAPAAENPRAAPWPVTIPAAPE